MLIAKRFIQKFLISDGYSLTAFYPVFLVHGRATYVIKSRRTQYVKRPTKIKGMIPRRLSHLAVIFTKC